ncbi:hypothetical protein FRAHR75_270010 [Frankia sp. Hr75.2]|nr:hypothetical protein FRAHR75_270010 [Frankia sp. Hr75.2]
MPSPPARENSGPPSRSTRARPVRTQISMSLGRSTGTIRAPGIGGGDESIMS